MVTAGMGVVEWNGKESGKQLLDRADQKLYAAKARMKSSQSDLVSV